MEFHYLTNSRSYYFSGCRRTHDKPFFIDYLKERKKRYLDHQRSILKIFEKWNEKIKIEPTNILDSHEPLFLSLYINITSQIREHDNYGYALAHLEHPSYVKIQSTYQDLKDKEGAHNKKVSEFFEKMTSDIYEEIYSKTHLIEAYDVKKLIEYDEDLNENDKAALELGVVNSTVGLYGPYLFRYLLNRSLDKSLVEKDLKIKDETFNGWVFHTLTSNRYLDNNQLIAKSNPAAQTDLQTLKEILISDKYIEISNKIKEFDSETKEIHKVYSNFIFETNRLVNDFPSLYLKGKCSVENELSDIG